MTRRLGFWLVVAVQAVIPLGMVGLQEQRYSGADQVLLVVEPVDPHDVFRGEYVQLSYDISRLRAPAGTVYVPLYRTGTTWTGSLATTSKPTGTFIRGNSDGSGRITFGIETFYVPEGRAREYERAMFDHRLLARVALRSDGRARVEELVVSYA